MENGKNRVTGSPFKNIADVATFPKALKVTRYGNFLTVSSRK